jgi:ParB/RepB/Spo0J family partition protein
MGGNQFPALPVPLGIGSLTLLSTFSEQQDAKEKAELAADGTKVETHMSRTPSIESGEVVMLPLEELDGQDTTFLFRATVRVGDLQRSLRDEGQQIPIIVRRTQGKKKYQIISGFRRTKAAAQLRWKEISAIVRSGLTDDEAFRASVLENTARKTYSDVDRAYIIRAYRDRGHGGEDVAKIMGLTDRQVRNLASLLELPETVQAAIDDPEQHFSTTHALTLKKLKGIYPRLDYRKWVAGVNGEQLSVSQLKRRVTAEYRGKQELAFESIFQRKGTDLRRGEFRFAPVKVVISEMSDEEKTKLKGELEALLSKI